MHLKNKNVLIVNDSEIKLQWILDINRVSMCCCSVEQQPGGQQRGAAGRAAAAGAGAADVRAVRAAVGRGLTPEAGAAGGHAGLQPPLLYIRRQLHHPVGPMFLTRRARRPWRLAECPLSIR